MNNKLFSNKNYYGIDTTLNKYLKPEFRTSKDEDELVCVSIYKNNKYGLIAKVSKFSWFMNEHTISKKELVRIEKRKRRMELREKKRGNKRINTSHWKRVDDLSRKYVIAQNVIMLHLTIPDWKNRDFRRGQISALMWDLCERQPNWWGNKPLNFGNFVVNGINSNNSLDGIVGFLNGTEGDIIENYYKAHKKLPPELYQKEIKKLSDKMIYVVKTSG